MSGIKFNEAENHFEAQATQDSTLEVSSANKQACSLYRKIGFETHGIRRNYYRNGSDAMIQWRYLKDIL